MVDFSNVKAIQIPEGNVKSISWNGNILWKIKEESPDYIKDGLQVYYSGIDNTGNGYDTTATTWADLSGNSNVGKMYKFSNGFGDNSGWGANGLKFRLNNINCGVVTINDKYLTDFFSTLPVTISCTYTVKTGGTYMGLFGNHGVGSDGFIVQYEGANSSAGWISGSGRTISSSSWAGTNSQHNLTMVLMSAKRIILYIDGKQIYDRSTFNGRLNSNMLFGIGNAFLSTGSASQAQPGRSFNGTIHNFLMYNRALSSDEVNYNYKIDLLKYFN